MSFMQELASWRSPPKKDLAAAPKLGEKAPSTSKLPVHSKDGKPMVVTFLRHCGCPFAEATFLNMRARASENPSINFIAVSHSSDSHTNKWLGEVGGAGNIQVIIDPEREIYSAWGLGVSSFMHVLSPSGLMAVRNLGKEKGIWNRPTESGSRWQTAGSWGVDEQGVVRWGGVAARADEMPDFKDAVAAVASGPGSKL